MDSLIFGRKKNPITDKGVRHITNEISSASAVTQSRSLQVFSIETLMHFPHEWTKNLFRNHPALSMRKCTYEMGRMISHSLQTKYPIMVVIASPILIYQSFAQFHSKVVSVDYKFIVTLFSLPCSQLGNEARNTNWHPLFIHFDFWYLIFFHFHFFAHFLIPNFRLSIIMSNLSIRIFFLKYIRIWNDSILIELRAPFVDQESFKKYLTQKKSKNGMCSFISYCFFTSCFSAYTSYFTYIISLAFFLQYFFFLFFFLSSFCSNVINAVCCAFIFTCKDSLLRFSSEFFLWLPRKAI